MTNTLDQISGPITPLPIERSRPKGAAKSRILIVDDTRAIHEDFRKILASTVACAFDQKSDDFFGLATKQSSSAAIEIESAFQGQEGLAFVEHAVSAGCPFSVVFLDVRMPPGWDGVETAAHLWKADPELQIVICTAYSDHSWDQITDQLGSRDSLVILKKPFDAVEVLQLTHALCKKWELSRQSKARLIELESNVEARTHELQVANQKLQQDIARRVDYERCQTALCALSRQLNVAKTASEAGEIIVGVADQLIGWDAFNFHLYSAAEDKVHCVLAMDTIDNRRLRFVNPTDTPSPMARRAIREGPLLILKENVHQPLPGAVPFGARNRPSASILFVQVRNEADVVGILSIHSYTPQAYNQGSLELLQSLADHCGGALARIQTAEALYATQERLNHLLRESPSVIYSTRFSAPSIEWISGNVLDVFGYSPEECVAPNWWPSHTHPDDSDCIVARVSGAGTLQDQTLEFRLRHKNGGYRWVRDQCRPGRAQNQADPEIVGTWIDITEQKLLEDQLRQAQKMEAIGQLAGGVAHDFNNLLTVILGNSELAQVNSDGAHEKERADCLQQVISASKHAANLTRQLLAFSRKQVLHAEPVHLNDVISNLTKMLVRIIGEDIELQCVFAPSLPLVLADVGMIEQVLMNLVVNARDAMPRGGKLRISTEQCSRTASAADHAREYVRLSVSDSGTGIAPEDLPHLFEPFFTTKEIGKGTGLGLATVHGIVKQHEGLVEVSSEIGAGAQFCIYLPTNAAAPHAKTGLPARDLPKGGRENILVVEDDEAVRKLTERFLVKSGYRVLTAASGPEALEVWKTNGGEFDLLLSDILMPYGLTGVELSQKLCSERPGLKVLLMSGYPGEAFAKSGSSSRPTPQILSKPFVGEDLIRALRATLDHNP